MELSAPTAIVFWISVIIAIIGLILVFGVFSIGIPAFWVMTVAFVLLALGNLIKGM